MNASLLTRATVVAAWLGIMAKYTASYTLAPVIASPPDGFEMKLFLAFAAFVALSAFVFHSGLLYPSMIVTGGAVCGFTVRYFFLEVAGTQLTGSEYVMSVAIAALCFLLMFLVIAPFPSHDA